MWKKPFILRWWSLLAGLIALLIFFPSTLNAQAQTDQVNRLPATNLVILVIENKVQVLRGGAQVWETARTNQTLVPGDHIRTGPRSRAAVLLSNQTTVRLDEKSEFLIEMPPEAAGAKARRLILNFVAGALHFLHRDPPSEMEIRMRSSTAAVRGTDFAMQLLEDGTAIVTVIDGNVELTNNLGSQTITNRQQGIVQPGRAPVVRPAITAINNIIQWTLYYPGILDPAELQLTEPERAALNPSLAAYNSGDLLDAVAKYPAGRAPQSQGERTYLAALLLSVGRVDEAEAQLSLFAPTVAAAGLDATRLVNALRQLIATVKLFAAPPIVNPQLATEWLAESYRRQSLAQLEQALKAAQSAASKSPQLGFAWARVAELEFSFGRINDSSEALQKALQFSPRNAQAIALNGFLYAAKNKINSAKQEFQRAIDIDGALANAWLGRGLCRFRQGDAEGGREDLLIAAALEPQRAFLRSYLGKAYAETNYRKRAEHELDLSKDFDPRDPTAWLYSALLKQQYNQINDAIRDLEHSQDLSTNRAVYRSEFLLDQDRAVRSANLAHIYRDAGMNDWSVREAGRAVSDDYANYSAHLFLANSYDELRDPNRINLRYETPAESEYLIANLLAPVGAGTLSETISQGEYSKLFERDRLHVVSRTEYLSRGAWYENGAQFGTFGNSSYSVEALYRTDPGQRPNNDFYERELRLHLKQQLTPDDSVYLRLVQYESEGGDRFQYYDPAVANPGLRTMERQEPTLTLGYHHEWNPNSHFLLTGALLKDTYEEVNPFLTFLERSEVNHQLAFISDLSAANLDLRSETELYSIEAQQIWQQPHNTTIVGGRFQTATFDVRNSNFQLKDAALSELEDEDGNTITPLLPNVNPHLERWSIYLYESWRPIDQLTLQGGLAYEHMRYPENIRYIPMSDSEQTVERLLPKAGFVWTPDERTALRGAYTRSLGGASLEQSIRIEPTEVAGFNQAFRSIVPETIVGGNAGARFETYDLALERRFGTDTYASIGGELLYSAIPRTLGAIIHDTASDPVIVSGLSELHDKINYRERSLFATLDQLIDSQVVVGASYRLTDVHFQQQFAESPAIGPPSEDQTSLLHRLDLHAIYNHPCGFFSQIQALWYLQDNANHSTESDGTTSAEIPGDEFWQLNVFAGYRFWQRKAQITIGLLNLTDQDYKLNPVVLYNELPRGRTFMARFDLSF